MNGLPAATVVPLVVPAAQGDRLAVLFDTHHERLYRLARRLAPSADEALDLVQETFLKAARAAHDVPVGPSNEEAWLVRVLINIRRDQWRRAAVRRRDRRYVDERYPTHADPERDLLIRMTVWRALDTLAPRRRAILVLHELEGLSVPAVASLLGISAVTVRWHLFKGRRELGAALRPLSGAIR